MTTTSTGGQTLGRWATLRLTAAGLCLIAVCYGLARFAYGMFLPAFRAEFGLDAQTAGAIASGSYIAYCVAIVVSTILTPRLGARVVAVSAGAVAAVGTAVVAVAPNALALAAGVLLAGSSTGIASPPLAHAVALFVRSGVRDRTQTVINAGTGAGVALAGPVALLTVGQWRLAWWAFAVIAAVVTVWVARAVPRRGDEPAVAGPGAARRRPRMPGPLLRAGGVRLIAAAALMGIASSAVWTFGRDLLGGAEGIGPTASAIAWILLGVCGLVGAITGDAVRRLGLRPAWTLSMLVLAAVTIAFALVPGSLATAWTSAAVFGAVYIVLTGLVLIWGTEICADAPAAGVGLGFLVLALGQAIGSPLVGALLAEAGPIPAFSVAAACAALGALIRPRPH
ncbi:MFS transporter [Brevibacterium casei]|uniref:MFS transporter n=1 Tax=Brevibacterium casei TaxID=33889 RepID=UPI0011A4158B|nr:MFS transporter [Brevibacterium casei]